MAKLLDFDHGVSKFEPQSCYYIHFWTNALRKGMSPPIFLVYELNSITGVIL